MFSLLNNTVSHYSLMPSDILMSFTAARISEVAFNETLCKFLVFQVEYLSYVARLLVYIRDISK